MYSLHSIPVSSGGKEKQEEIRDRYVSNQLESYKRDAADGTKIASVHMTSGANPDGASVFPVLSSRMIAWMVTTTARTDG